jgi:hypothetical protein
MGGEDNTGHTSRSIGLLHLKASRARVSQSSLKTGEDVVQMVHVDHHRGRVEMKLKMNGSM